MADQTDTRADLPQQDDTTPEDARKEWVAPDISELPVGATRGTIGTGADAGVYS